MSPRLLELLVMSPLTWRQISAHTIISWFHGDLCNIVIATYNDEACSHFDFVILDWSM
jgi:hypothetical protein